MVEQPARHACDVCLHGLTLDRFKGPRYGTLQFSMESTPTDSAYEHLLLVLRDVSSNILWDRTCFARDDVCGAGAVYVQVTTRTGRAWLHAHALDEPFTFELVSKPMDCHGAKNLCIS